MRMHVRACNLHRSFSKRIIRRLKYAYLYEEGANVYKVFAILHTDTCSFLSEEARTGSLVPSAIPFYCLIIASLFSATRSIASRR